MKHIYTDATNTHVNRYYQCETQEEYDETLANCRKNESESVYEGQIRCYPHTEVSDGYAISGGREIVAEGFEYWWYRGGMHDRMVKSNYYIKPDGIIKNDTTKPEGWWV